MCTALLQSIAAFRPSRVLTDASEQPENELPVSVFNKFPHRLFCPGFNLKEVHSRAQRIYGYSMRCIVIKPGILLLHH